MIEFALVYAELFKYEISPQSSQYENAVNDRKKLRAAKVMLISEIKDADKIGFLHALFKDDVEMSFGEFKKRILTAECYWIFDDKAIRKRYKNQFANEEFLEEIEAEQIMHDKTEKLSLAEWQFLKQMERRAIQVNVDNED